MNRHTERFTKVCLLLILACSVVAEEAAQPATWKPFLLNKDKKQVEFPATPQGISKLKDKDWLTIGYSEFTGPKVALGVYGSEGQEFQTQTMDPAIRQWLALMGQSSGTDLSPANNIEKMVRQALRLTNRFTMLERTTGLESVNQEQALGESGQVDKQTRAEIGQFKGAPYVVKTAVVEINPEKEASEIKAVGGALTGAGIFGGGIGVKGKVAFCRVNVVVINSKTTEIVEDVMVDGTASSSGLSIGGAAGGWMSGALGGGKVGGSSEKQASIADAVQVAANKAAYVVAQTFTRLGDSALTWEGAVAMIDPSGLLMVNGGTNVGLHQDLTLTVFSKGAEILDPTTGASLGSVTQEIGKIRITSVAEKFAQCSVTNGCEGVKVGDMVKLSSN